MITATVLETIEIPGKVWVNCRDNTSGDTCAIYVGICVESRCISERDEIRWGDGSAYWMPRERLGGRALLNRERKLIYLGESKVKPTFGVKLEKVEVASSTDA